MDKIRKVFIGEIKETNDEERTLTALISTKAVDREGEALSPDGVNLANYKKNPVVMWAHNYREPPIGKNLWIKKTADGILAKTQFAKTAFADEIFSLYKGDFLKAWSVGFIPDQDAVDEDPKADGKKKPRRTYNKWELLEYSAVPIPANPEALTQAVEQGLVKTKALIEDLGITITNSNDEDKGDKGAIQKEPELKTLEPEKEPEIKTEDKVEVKLTIVNRENLKTAQALIQRVLDGAKMQEGIELNEEKTVIVLDEKKEEKKEPSLNVEGTEIAGEKLQEIVKATVAGAIRKLKGKVD